MHPDAINHFCHANYAKNIRLFGIIPPQDRLHESRCLCGYLKYASLCESPENFRVESDGDEIILRGLDSAKITEEDILYLMRCGLMWDNKEETFSHA